MSESSTEELAAPVESTSPPPETPLDSSWVFWVHRKGANGGVSYGSNMDSLGSFNTIEGFWRYMHQVPPPSDMFSSDKGATKYSDREIDAVSVFRKGIRPEWEDPKNMTGAEFSLKKTMGGGQLDTYWEELLMGAVGETLDPANTITGVRVVDKSSKGKFAYRLEVWFETNTSTNGPLVDALRGNITDVLNGGQKLEYKAHSASLAGGGEFKGHRGGRGG